MAETVPSTAATATLAAAAATVKVLTVAGIPLGLRPDIMLAGFSGAVVAIILLDSVPGSSDTIRNLLLTTLRRFFVVLASSLTAGYLVPAMAGHAADQSNVLLFAFGVGAGAQQVLKALIARLANKTQRDPTEDRP